MVATTIIILGLGIFTFFALGGTLLATTGTILGVCVNGTFAILGMPLTVAGIIGTLLTNITNFLYAS